MLNPQEVRQPKRHEHHYTKTVQSRFKKVHKNGAKKGTVLTTTMAVERGQGSRQSTIFPWCAIVKESATTQSSRTTRSDASNEAAQGIQSEFFLGSRRIVRPMYREPPKQKHHTNTEKSIFTTNRRSLVTPPAPNIHRGNRSTRNGNTEVPKNIAIKSTCVAEKHHRRHFVVILLRIWCQSGRRGGRYRYVILIIDSMHSRAPTCACNLTARVGPSKNPFD